MSRSLISSVRRSRRDILFGFCAFGQAPTGTLQGRVADPAGSAIPDAKVTIENQNTASSRRWSQTPTAGSSSPIWRRVITA